MTPRKNRGVFTYLIIIIIAIGCIYLVSSKLAKGSDKTTYNEVMEHFDKYEVSYYELDLGSGELTYRIGDDSTKKKYEVPNVSLFLQDTENYCQEYNKKHPNEPLEQNFIKITDRTWLYSLIPVLITVILGVLIIYFMIKQSNGGGKLPSTTLLALTRKNRSSRR